MDIRELIDITIAAKKKYGIVDKPKKISRLKYEAEAKVALEEMGYTVHKGGWPDFFCFTESGQIAFIEAKGTDMWLSPSQYAFLRLLRKYVKVQIWIARPHARHDERNHYKLYRLTKKFRKKIEGR